MARAEADSSFQHSEVGLTRSIDAQRIDRAFDRDFKPSNATISGAADQQFALLDFEALTDDQRGVPFAVKDLFDLAGIVARAGAKISEDNPAVTEDATAVARLRAAGAVPLGALNMDEYAYGFTTENSHYGPTRNPRDLRRIAGGSSGGSAAAVAAGFVPLALGSDTNGSVRVPAALCGIFGFKPTYGRLSRAGMTLFASSFDHVGLFARSARDLAIAYDALQGPDRRDPVCSTRPPELTAPQLDRGITGLRVAIASDSFQQGGEPEVFKAVEQVAAALGTARSARIPEAERARAAAYLITAAEGATQHLARWQARAQDFDPATRDRFLAGALIPAPWYVQAQRFRRWYRDRLRDLFQEVDILLAPTTPCAATPIGQAKAAIAGETLAIRPNLGRFTQPLSFVGLPVLSVPVQRPHALPLGVQLIAAPYQEASLLRVAAALQQQGVVAAPVAV